jgi:lysophospholipase L1-like esterase
VTEKSGDPRRSQGAGTATDRIEQFFARVGISAAALLLVVGVIALDLLLTDLAVPLANPIGKDFLLVTQDGRELGQGQRGGLRLMLTPFTIYENLPDDRIGINSFGLRGPEIDQTPSRPRIIVIGGSAVYGHGYQHTFVTQLGRRRPDCEILNAGVIGYLTSQELALVVFRLLDLQPQLIIAFNGWNDLYDRYWWKRYGHSESGHRGVNINFNIIEARLINYRRIRWDPTFALLETAQSIVRNSTLLSALGRVLRPGLEAPAPPDLSPAVIEEAVAGYIANMTMLRDVSRSRGSRLIVVLQPELGQLLTPAEIEWAKVEWVKLRELNPEEWDDEYWITFPPAYRQFRARAYAGLADAGIAVIDGSSRLKTNGAGSAHFLDPVHLTAAGHSIVAEFLSAEIPPGGFLREPD